MRILFDRRGDSEWTVRKVIVFILLLIVLVLVVWGVFSGKMIPLFKGVGAKFDSFLILLGLANDDGSVAGVKDCVAYDDILVPLKMTEGVRGDFLVCRSGLCWFNFSKGVGYSYYGPTGQLYYNGPNIVNIGEDDLLYNLLFNEGVDRLYQVLDVDSYGGTSGDGLEVYMGGDEAPEEEKVDEMRGLVGGEIIRQGESTPYFLDVEMGKGRYPVVSIEGKGGKYGLFYVGSERNPDNYWIAESNAGELPFYDRITLDGMFGVYRDYFESVERWVLFNNLGVVDGFRTNEGVFDFDDLTDSSSLLEDPLFKEMSPEVQKVVIRAASAYDSGGGIGMHEFYKRLMDQSVHLRRSNQKLYQRIASGEDSSYDPILKVPERFNIELRDEPLRLVKWKEGRNGDMGWYSHGDVGMNMIERDEFKEYYKLSQVRAQKENIRKIFEEKCT